MFGLPEACFDACQLPLHSAQRSDNLHACDPYHPLGTPHVAWLADNLLPAPHTEPIIRSRIQAGTADSGKQQQHDLSPHKYSFCQTRPLKTIILEMSPNSRFDNAWHRDRSMRSKPSFSLSNKTPDVRLQSWTRINNPGSDYLRPAR
jgi:hypothetical protein